MRQLVMTILLTVCGLTAATAQTAGVEKQDGGMRELRDKKELKELVDVFSILADKKDVEAQVLLFTEDATVDSYRGDSLVSSIRGRENLAQGFGAFLALFDTVYHINGQQTVKIDGDLATGTAYCQVVLIGMQDGHRVMTTQGVVYDDEYVRQGGKWLIAKRTSHFVWTDAHEIGQ